MSAEIPPISPEGASVVSDIWNEVLKGILDKPIEFEFMPKGLFGMSPLKDGLFGAFETKDGISASVLKIREIVIARGLSGVSEVLQFFSYKFLSYFDP